MIDHYPPEFIAIIQDLLGESTPQFWAALAGRTTSAGLRINSLKGSAADLLSKLTIESTPLPWVEEGFGVDFGNQLGVHSLHGAGAFYLQEPSAMLPAAVLAPRPGEKVLDLCAAPGGKSTQILSRMNNQGWLLANDPNPNRVQALVRNLDRWGARNSLVCTESPARLYHHLGSIFDRVLIDAPCSGEGTFRLDPKAKKNWSTRFQDRCANIQDEIIWYGSKLVRPGGVLVYSTCTFNRTENEGTIERFLSKKSGFMLDPIQPVQGFSPGIPRNIPELVQTVRIWPHLAPGEGHFIARLIRSEAKFEKRNPREDSGKQLEGEQLAAYQDFYSRTIHINPQTEDFHPQNHRLRVYGNQLYLPPGGSPSLDGLRVEHWGWHIGTIQGKRFIPSPALASGLQRDDCQKVLEFSLGDPDLVGYQRGSPIRNHTFGEGNGEWILAVVEGYSLGWAKLLQGSIKSYYPNWLRKQ